MWQGLLSCAEQHDIHPLPTKCGFPLGTGSFIHLVIFGEVQESRIFRLSEPLASEPLASIPLASEPLASEPLAFASEPLASLVAMTYTASPVSVIARQSSFVIAGKIGSWATRLYSVHGKHTDP